MIVPRTVKQGSAPVLRRFTAASLAVVLAAGMAAPLATYAHAEEEPAAVSEAAEADFAGWSVVAEYLDGQTPTLDDLAQVDFDALRAWDVQVADELLALKAVLETEASAPEPPAGSGSEEAPAVPADGSEDAPAPEETASVAPAVVPDEVPAEAVDPFNPDQEYPEWLYSGDTSFTMIHYTEDMDAQKLVAAIGEQARQAAQEHGISASEMIALAVIKSDSGRSLASQAPYRNLFRASDGAGALCAYDTFGACLEERAALVASGEESSVPDDPAWAGDYGSLAERVQAVVEDYDLTRYDVPLDEQPMSPLAVQVWDEAAGAFVDQPATLAGLADEAVSHLGVPYVWGGTTPEGFDCSGLVQHAYAQALQMDIPRTTYYQCLVGEDVDFADLHTGDLLFFVKDGVAGHVAMYLGEGCYIEAPQPGMEVKVTAMDEKTPAFAKRLVATESVPEEQLEAQAAEAALSPEQAACVAEQQRAAAAYEAWRAYLGR